MELREFQTNAVSMLRQSIGQGKIAPLLVMSTGAGKTRTAAAICKSATEKGKRVLFITPRRGLTLQAEQAFYDLGIESGIIMAGIEHDPRHRVEVASMDTIISRLGKDHMTNALLGVQAADILIVDEAHLSVSKKRQEFLLAALAGEYDKRKIVIGLTASPCVNGGGGLGAVYDDLLVPVTMSELIDQGYLVQPRYYAAEKPDLSDVKMTGGEYQADGLGDAFADNVIMGDVVTNWWRIAKDTSTVVFTPTRANAASLVERFIGAGVKAEYLDANTTDEDRAEIYSRVTRGRTKVICNVGIVSLGVDIPRIQTVVMATATKSVAKWMQAVGRALRPYEGKDCAFIIDHGGMSIDAGMGPVEFITDWSLDDKTTIQDRTESRKIENKEPKEITCKKCKTVFKGRRTCPACGNEMKQKTEEIEYYEADLKEVKRKKVDKNDKQRVWNDCIYTAQYRGLKCGAAAHMYKKQIGTWPRGLEKMPKADQWQMLAKNFLASLRAAA